VACVEDTRKPNPDRARPCAWMLPSSRAELRIVANDTTGAAASRNWAVERAGLPNYDNSGEHARRSSTLRVRPAQPVLRAPPDLVAFLAGFFLAGAFFAAFLAGVRVFSPRLFCSRATKSTTLVVASSLGLGSSRTRVVAPLSLTRFRMISDRRSRNSLRYASGFHSVAME